MSLDKDAALSDHFTLKIHLLCDSSCADFNVNVFKKIFSKTSYSVNVVSLLQEQVETSSKLISLNNFFSKIPTPCLFYDIVFESAAPAPPKRVKTSLLTKHLHQSIVFNINFLQGDPSPGRYQKRNGSLSDLNHMINEELSIFQHNVYLDKNNGSRCIQFLDTSTTLVGETIVMSVIQRIVHRAIYCYIVNLMSHISNFKRHLIVEENKKLGGVQMSSKEKEIFCYVRKKIGDFYLFLGAPLFSLQMYSEIQEIMWKNSNSSWSAFCQESEAAAIYFYFLYIEQNTQENETNCLSSTGDTFLHCKNISAELERIVCDTSKFWTLYLPGNSKATKSHLVDFLHDTTLINASPLVPLHRHFEEMSNFVSSTFKNKKESLEIFGLILIKLKEAFHEYDKLGSKGLFWRLELLLKMMRLLVKTFNKKIILTRILCKVVDDLQQTSHFHQQEMYSALANILLPCQMYRHYSFLIFQNVHLQIKQCVTLYSLQQLCDTISYLYLQDVLIYRMNKCVDQNILSNCKTMDLQLSSLNDVFVFTAPMNSITLLLSSKYFHKNLTRFNFYQQHLKKIKIYQNDACHLFWPCLQVCVLKTLIILYTTLQQYEQAAFIVYTLLIKCHSVFNFKNTSTCLHLLHQLSQQMHEPLKLPVSLVVSSLNTSQVVKKNKREPEKNLTLTKKTLSFYGGVTQGSCPPLPTLCHIQVCQLKRGYWYQNSGQDYFHTFCETQLEETDFVNSTLKKSVVSQPFPCTNSHLMTFKTNYTNSMRSNSQVQQECVWFVGEPVVVELTVRSSLNVPLHIDAVHIQTLGAPLETKDVTLTLQPFSVQKFHVTVKPLKEEPFWIIGATFHLFHIHVPIFYLLLNNDVVMKSFQFKEKCTLQTESTLLKSGSAIYGVVYSYPELLPRYYGDPLKSFQKKLSPHSSLFHTKNHNTKQVSLKTLTTDCEDNFFPIHSLYEFVPSKLTDCGTLNFYLGLTNTSSTLGLHKIQLCCVQDLGEDVQDFLYHKKKPYTPPDKWFLHYFQSNNFSVSDPNELFLSIQKQTCLKSALPSSPFVKVEPLILPHNSNTRIEVHNLQPNQTFYIHLHARLGECLSQNAGIIVRYTSRKNIHSARFLFLPISFPVIQTPLLCILRNSLHVQPKTSIDIHAVSSVILQCFEFSDFVLSALTQSISSTNALVAVGIFHKNEYELTMMIANNSSDSMHILAPKLCQTFSTKQSEGFLSFSKISFPPSTVSKCFMDLMLTCDFLHSTSESISNPCENDLTCDTLEEAIHRTLGDVCYEDNGVNLPLTLRMEPPLAPSTMHLSIASGLKLKPENNHLSSWSLPYQSHIWFSECSVSNSITGQLYQPENKRVFHVPCFVPLNVTLTLQRFTTTKLVMDQCATNLVAQKNTAIRVILIPYETLYVKQKTILQHQAASCENNSILQYSYSRSYENCLWCGSLEKSTNIGNTATVTFTLIMTTEGLTQTLFSAYITENPLCFIWNASSYILLSDRI